MKIALSIVIPVLNERDSLCPLFAKIRDALSPLPHAYEVIFVDDGSGDGSNRVLEELYLEHPEVEVVELRRNFGKAAAYAAGFRRARGGWIVTLDADLQDDPAEIPKLLETLEKGYDLVSGWRVERADSLGKILLSRVFNAVTRRASGIPLHDFNCGLKAYRREVLEAISLYGELHRFIPALAHREGFRVTEVQVRHHPRAFVSSKYGWARIPRGFWDLVTVVFLGRYLGRPLHLFGTLGVSLGGVGLGINLYIASLWFESGHIRGRYPLLILGILLLVLGAQFVCTGLLAELIARRVHPAEDFRTRRLLSRRA